MGATRVERISTDLDMGWNTYAPVTEIFIVSRKNRKILLEGLNRVDVIPGFLDKFSLCVLKLTGI